MGDERSASRRSAGSIGQEYVAASVLVVAALVVVAGGVVGAAVGMPHHPTMPMASTQQAPAERPAFMLAAVSPEIAEHYRFAADHPAPYRNVPCFCGCRDMLGHRDLYDCFVAPDGGWDPHASGCAVCTQESAQVRRMVGRGASFATIRSSITERFGALTS
jgi:Protein of unknown function with PCYCGC motif